MGAAWAEEEVVEEELGLFALAGSGGGDEGEGFLRGMGNIIKQYRHQFHKKTRDRQRLIKIFQLPVRNWRGMEGD